MRVLGVSFDSAEENARFAEKQGFPFPLLCDVKHEVGLAYRACESVEDQYPRRITYIVSADGKIEKAIETKNPATQADELLAYFAGAS